MSLVILLAGDMGDGEAFKRLLQLLYRLYRGLSEAFFTRYSPLICLTTSSESDLEVNLFGAQPDGFFQGGDDSRIFRLVIGGLPDAAGNAGNQPSLLVLDDSPYRRQARVAQRGAIGTDYHSFCRHILTFQARNRMRPQLLHCTSLPLLACCRSVVGSDIRQPRHIPCSTLATAIPLPFLKLLIELEGGRVNLADE